MQRPNFLPTKASGYGHVLSNTCGSTTRQMPFVSLSSNFRPMFSWERVWRLTNSDTTAVEFVACLTAQNILLLASPKWPEHCLPNSALAAHTLRFPLADFSLPITLIVGTKTSTRVAVAFAFDVRFTPRKRTFLGAI